MLLVIFSHLLESLKPLRNPISLQCCISVDFVGVTGARNCEFGGYYVSLQQIVLKLKYV